MDRKEVIERLREMANGPAAVHGTDALDTFAAAADMLAADGWVKCSLQGRPISEWPGAFDKDSDHD